MDLIKYRKLNFLVLFLLILLFVNVVLSSPPPDEVSEEVSLNVTDDSANRTISVEVEDNDTTDNIDIDEEVKNATDSDEEEKDAAVRDEEIKDDAVSDEEHSDEEVKDAADRDEEIKDDAQTESQEVIKHNEENKESEFIKKNDSDSFLLQGSKEDGDLSKHYLGAGIIVKPNYCYFAMVPGNQMCSQPRSGHFYFYSYALDQCVPFFYWGCGGNNNRFANALSCICTCVGDLNQRQRCPSQGFAQPPVISPWSSCSVSCGMGISSRSHCSGICTTETRSCYAGRACLSAWTNWGPWTGCMATCGPSWAFRFRQCTPVGSTCAGSSQDQQTCNVRNCGSWGPWLPASRCSVTCGIGRRTMRRTCLPAGSTECPGQSLVIASCIAPSCQGIWEEWGEWTPCTVTCGEGVTSRQRFCISGLNCVGSPSQSQPCIFPPCPSGIWGSFTAWTDCSSSCGAGTQERSRICLTGTGTCQGLETDVVDCNLGSCERGWEDWLQWTSCSVSCGTGTQSRIRECRSGQCAGPRVDIRQCSNEDCQENGQEGWGDWTIWGSCSARCGAGQETRARGCMTNQPCQGEPRQTRPCFGDCGPDGPVGVWGNWTIWTPCSSNCGPGRQQRQRICVMPVCLGPQNDTRSCSGSCTVSNWNTWNQWEGCSVTCGVGQDIRTRTCNGDNCEGFTLERRRCDPPECISDTGISTSWGQWSNWEGCSVSCGGGQQRRTRVCAGGNNCLGDNSDFQSCNEGFCPDTVTNGQWETWSDWQSCTVTCGGGEQRRTRLCNEENGCEGSDEEFQSCNEETCAEVTSQWDSWNDWEACSVSCGGGQQRRTRLCIGGNNCVGNNDEFQSCGEETCIGRRRQPSWQSWGICTVTCGGGEQQRRRICDGGVACDEDEAERRQCNDVACPREIGAWDEWRDWQTCSSSCGLGTQPRSRGCAVPPCTGVVQVRRPCSATWGCSDTGTWDEWNEWSQCDAPCGEAGEQQRTRECRGSNCEGSSTQILSCEGSPCPVPVWGDWGQWGACASTCGSSNQMRQRTCGSTGRCTGASIEERRCDLTPCEDQSRGTWTEWGDVESCSTTCGPGSTTRRRACPGGGCLGTDMEITGCLERDCGGWELWTDWSPCSVSCASGLSFRRRNCLSGSCQGNAAESRSCNSEDCPGTDWRPWSEWGACSVTCGGGNTRRNRQCGGDNCPGSMLQEKICNELDCSAAVDEELLLSADLQELLEMRFSENVIQKLKEFRAGWKLKARKLDVSGDEIIRNDFEPSNIQKRWWKKFYDQSRVFHSRRKRQAGASTVLPRREYRTLTRDERIRFHNALWKMKTTMVDGLSEYDMFVQFHQPNWSPGAHTGPAFLPWHREFIFRFELVLRSHDRSVMLPYWDTTLDSELPDPLDSIIWSDEFMGTAQGEVTTGPLRFWPVLERCRIGGSDLLLRSVADIEGLLFKERDISFVASRRSYTDITSVLEFEHGGPHLFVGGHMDNVTCSPADPTFFLHHSFVDFIWEEFRQTRQTRQQREMDYPRNTSTLHHANVIMTPFDPLENIHGLQNIYVDSYFRFAPRPLRCFSNSDCGGYLFCHQSRCKSKIRLNGTCTGLPEGSPDPCQCGFCLQGFCRLTNINQRSSCFR